MAIKRLLAPAVFILTLAPGLQSEAHVPRAVPSRAAGGLSFSQAGWVRVTPPAEEFSVLMPGTPVMGWERHPAGGRAAIINYYGLNFDETIYVVISMGKQDAPPPELAHILMLNLFNKFIPSSILDKVEENEKSVRSAYVREISLAGYPGRAHTLRAHNRSGLSNFYVTGKNYYLAGALTSGNNAASVKKFLDSFELAPPPAQTAARATAAPPPPAVATGERGRVSTRPDAGSTWLVVLKTYPKAERARAEQKRAAVRRLGHEARIVESDNYPNLRKGYLVLVAGPYAKGGAELVLSRVRRVAADAYIKSGW